MPTYYFNVVKTGKRTLTGHRWLTVNVYQNTRMGIRKIGNTRHQTGGGSIRSTVSYYLKRKGINTNRKDIHLKEL